MVRNRGRIAHTARLMAAEGSRVHLGGHGGDELFRPTHTYLHDLVRTKPYTGLRHARAHRISHRWAAGDMLRALADRRTPGREAARHAATLRAPLPGYRDVFFGWAQPPPRLPAWVTDEAADAAAQLLRAAAAEPVEPLALQRAQHNVLLLARGTGSATRVANRNTAHCGPPIALPYLDDQVLHAALSVRLEERNSPWRFKPLLAAAMRGTVPGTLLDRTTKGTFGADYYEGLRRHRHELLDLFDGSELARHGLIDDGALRQALLRPHPDTSTTLYALDATLACETWLRSLKSRTGAEPGPARSTDPASKGSGKKPGQQ